MTVVSKRDLAEINKFNAEASAYEQEAQYHRLQSERLVRARIEEDAAIESQRILDFTSEVGYGSVRQSINMLSEWRSRDPKAPIVVRLMTPGGDAMAGLAFYDYMRSLVNNGTPLTTIAIGMAASMGAILLQAGSTRLVTPSCWVMIHEVSNVVGGKLSELIDEAKFSERIQDRLLDILSERSHLSKLIIKRKWKRKDWWMSAPECVKVGFADAVSDVP